MHGYSNENLKFHYQLMDIFYPFTFKWIEVTLRVTLTELKYLAHPAASPQLVFIGKLHTASLQLAFIR